MTEEKEYLSVPVDSMCGLTITHSFYKCSNEDIDHYNHNKNLENMKDYFMELNSKIKFRILEKTTINGLIFEVCGTIHTTYKKMINQNLYATVYYKDNRFAFNFLKSSSHLEDTAFIADSYEMLKTIKIK
jgi:hypothetical protein